MNQITELETQLRSWTPRAAPVSLERRLFGRRLVERDSAPNFRLAWLAPAMAGVVALAMLFAQRNSPIVTGAAGSNALVAVISSNRNVMTTELAPTQAQKLRAAKTLGWTNGSGSTSSISSLSTPRGSN
jgi:hypothetical protein